MTTQDTFTELAGAFRRMGLSESEARRAAHGRQAGRAGLREVVKNVAGLPASCFAWVPSASPEDPTTWRLQISRSADDGTEWKPDPDLVRAAVAQLPGIAGYGQGLPIPAADLPAVRATLRAAWVQSGLPIDEMPKELALEGLRKEFRRLGVEEAALEVAVRGRKR
jgi:hypothetical protein